MSFFNAAQKGFVFATVPHAVAANDVLVLKSVSVPKGSLGQLNISGVIFHLGPGTLITLPDIIVTGGVTVDVENLDGTTMAGARVLGYEGQVQISETLDTNVLNAVTSSMELNEAHFVGIQVIGLTGAHTTHVVKMEVSNDNTNWATAPAGAVGVTGAGVSDISSSFRYGRLKVTTAEGGASTCTVILHAKN